MSGGLVSFVINRIGGNNLKDMAGYQYVKTKSIPLKDRPYWRCMMKQRYSCPVTLVIKDSTMILDKMNGEHTHGNMHIEQKVREVEEEKIKIAAAISTVVSRTILGEIAVDREDNMTGGTAFMRNQQSLSMAIQRKRVSMKGYPSRPKTFDDLEFIPSNLMRTTDDQPFLILNDTIIHGDTKVHLVQRGSLSS
jgi:hypothetical protein